MGNWLNAVLDPLKAAGETAKGLMEIRDTVKFADTVIQLQAQIMAAQQGAFEAQAREAAMSEEIRDLKKRVSNFETWDTEKKRYQLTDFGGGTYAYVLKDDMSQGEPPHRLCTACFQKNQKSILQFRHNSLTGQAIFDCPACSTEFRFGVSRDTPVQAITDYDPLA